MIELVSIVKTGETWYLNKIVVNPQHISIVSEAREHNIMLREDKIHIGLSKHVSFSSITMDVKSGFEELIVVGTPEQLLEKIRNTNRQLLRG